MGAFDDLIPTQTENPFSDLIPESKAQAPSLDREVEREDLRRQVREARAEGIGDKAILGLAELGERAAYTASLMDPLTAIGRVINPYQQTPLPAETVRKAIDFFDPLSRSDVVAGSAMEGAKQFGSELISGLAQPEAAAAMLTGKVSPQLPGRLFQPGLIKASPQAAAALAEAETPAEATKAALELGLTVGGTAGIEAHGARAGRARPTDLRELEPVTSSWREMTKDLPTLADEMNQPGLPLRTIVIKDPFAESAPKVGESYTSLDPNAPVSGKVVKSEKDGFILEDENGLIRVITEKTKWQPPIPEPTPKPTEPAPVPETAKPSLTPEQEALQRELAGEMESSVDITPQSVTVPEMQVLATQTLNNGAQYNFYVLPTEGGNFAVFMEPAGSKRLQAYTGSMPLAEAQQALAEAVVPREGKGKIEIKDPEIQRLANQLLQPKTETKEPKSVTEIPLPYGLSESDVAAAGGDIGRAVETAYERAKESGAREEAYIRETGSYSWNTKNKRWGQVWTDTKRDEITGNYQVIAGLEGTLSGIPVAEFRNEQSARNFSSDFRSGRIFALKNGNQWVKMVDSAYAAKPFLSPEGFPPLRTAELLKSYGRTQGATERGNQITVKDLQGLYDAGHTVKSIDTFKSAPPPSPAKVAEVKPESVPPAEQPTPPPAVSPTEGKGKQAWEMTQREWQIDQGRTNWGLGERIANFVANEGVEPLRPTDAALSKIASVLGFTKADVRRALETYNWGEQGFPELDWGKYHKKILQQAIKEGKPVPAEVLADYPDLAPKPTPPQPSAGIEKQKAGEGKLSPTDKGISKEEKAFRATAEGQKTMASRASRIATLQQVNEAIRRKDPNEAYSQELIATLPDSQIDGMLENLRETWNKLAKPEPPTPGPGAQTVGEPKASEIQGMGGATPAEFAKGQGSPTAMKYRLIDQERRKRGLEPLAKPDRISDQAVMDKAIGEMDRNPNLPDQLIKELNEKPRAIEDWENHVLLLRKIELREEYHKAAREAMQAYADSAQFPERLADMQAANARTQWFSERLTELEQASRVAGSSRGRALRALRVMANEDFSLASLEMEKRAANNWRPLTPDERGELIKIADEHKAKSEELQKRLDELEKAQQEKEVGAVLTNLKGEVGKTPKAAVTPVEVSAAKIRQRLSKNPNADIRFFVRKIARYFVSQGTKERNTLIDQVHGVLSEIIPDLDKRTTADLISGYGDYSRLPKDTVSVILRDLSGQMQQISKLEDMMSGKAPLRSGQERRTPTDVERILQKQVEEQKKKGGYTVTDPETQLRTAQQAVQKRLENQIKDLELQIQTRQKIIKNPTKLQYDKKNLELQARRNELKAVYDEIFAKPPKTEAERLAAWKERTRDRIDELKEFLEGTKQPKQRPTPVVLDKEALRIRFDLHTIERVWREKLYKDKLSQQATIDKVIRGGKELLNVPRAMMASYDLSAPGRQGIIIGLAHPIRSARALKPMFEAWHSEKGAFKAAEELRNRDNAPLYETSKLYLAEHGGRLSAQEEVYMSRWAQKIPGVRKSERAYVTFLNRLRADSFDAMVKGLTVDGKGNPAELKAIANFINVATGRGTGLERYAETLNTTFFAPRYVASRFQFLLGQPFYRGSARTRGLIAKEYGRFLAGAAVVYGLAMAADADVEHDWRSSDFGKIRIGDTRIDPMAGLVQNSTLIGRTLTGETKTIKGKVHPLWPASKVPFNRDNWFDVITRFGRSKLAPVPGNVVNLVLGQNVVGQPVTPADVAIQSVTPISWRDVYQNMIDNGVPAGMAMGILSIFGVGVNTYDQQNRK